MPVAVSYPGVYVEEVPSGSRTITGVATSVAAFIGQAPRGPLDTPVRIQDWGSYEREFGGLHRDSELGYAVQQFFLNGGTECWVVRVAQGGQKAAVTLQSFAKAGLTAVLDVSARSKGGWGNGLRLDVDYATSSPDSTFNLKVTEYARRGDDIVEVGSETFLNLTMNSRSADYVVSVVNSTSRLISVQRNAAATTALDPNEKGALLSGDLTALLATLGLLGTVARRIQVIIDGDGPYEVECFPANTPVPDRAALAAAVTAAVKAVKPGEKRFKDFAATWATADGVADAAGTCLLLASGSAGADLEFASVRVLPAASLDASRALRLGSDGGARTFDGAWTMRPAAGGTVTGDLAAADLTTLPTTKTIVCTAKDGSTVLGTGDVTLGAAFAPTDTLPDVARRLQGALRASNANVLAIAQATVTVEAACLRIRSGDSKRPDLVLEFADKGNGTLATKLKILPSHANVARYSLGSGAVAGAQASPVPGIDGGAPSGTDLIGSRADRTGLFALEGVDLFNLLSIPRMGDLPETEASAVVAAALAYCIDRRAFLFVDPPKGRKSVDQMLDFVANGVTPDNHAAVYFPWVQIPDPLDRFRLKDVAPSGTLAGVFARTDASRGVWKAPAGVEATLANVPSLAVVLTDPQNGTLNKSGCNCLRQIPVYGRIAWGARTLRGADLLADDYKYVPVRRLALYIEETLFRNSKWIVFEGNDEPLWAQIRMSFDAFLHDLFTQGAFQGKTPKEAYFVKCDRETTTQYDIDRGIVNIVVGFAPLKPAEFVVIKIQQMAGAKAS